MEQFYSFTLMYLKQITGKKNVHKLAQNGAILIFMLMASITSYAQDAQGPYPCQGCTSNDFTFEQYFLGDANHNPLPACETPGTVSAYLWLKVTSSNTRYSLRVFYNLAVTTNPETPESNTTITSYEYCLYNDGTNGCRFLMTIFY